MQYIFQRISPVRLSILALFSAIVGFVAMFTLAVQGGIDGIAGMDRDQFFAATHPITHLGLWALAIGGAVMTMLFTCATLITLTLRLLRFKRFDFSLKHMVSLNALKSLISGSVK